MKRIPVSRYREILAAAMVLERDRYGEKVLVQSDGTLVKIFRRKRWLTTAIFFPYAQRFASNACMLAERGILTVEVLGLLSCPAMRRHLVIYRPLPGKTLRQALAAEGSERCRFLGEFGSFVANLHRSGVYFRSLHFGNVIVPPAQGKLGLIDVADMGLYSDPLPLRLRVRNFRHMLRYQEDIAALQEYGASRFVADYLAAAGLSPDAGERFRTMLAKACRDLLPLG